MKLYIEQDGYMLHKRGERIIIKKEKEKIKDLPLLEIEEVVVKGNTGLTGAIIQKLLEKNIPITYLSYYGEYRGRLVPKYDSRAKLRLEQFKLATNDKLKLKLSKEIVIAKVKNMKTIILKSRVANKDIKLKVEKIKNLKSKIKNAANIEQLRGYEGLAARYYFSSFSDLIKNNEFVFNGRSKRPPKDEINSMLSYGYTILYNEIVTAIYLAGLDPYISFYHSIENSRESLALDLIEEFRQVIVDSIVKKLVNKKMVKKVDFIREENGVYMKKKVRSLLLKEFNKKLSSKINHPILKNRLSWSSVIKEQAELLKRVIKNTKKSYIPMQIR